MECVYKPLSKVLDKSFYGGFTLYFKCESRFSLEWTYILDEVIVANELIHCQKKAKIEGSVLKVWRRLKTMHFRH